MLFSSLTQLHWLLCILLLLRCAKSVANSITAFFNPSAGTFFPLVAIWFAGSNCRSLLKCHLIRHIKCHLIILPWPSFLLWFSFRLFGGSVILGFFGFLVLDLVFVMGFSFGLV